MTDGAHSDDERFMRLALAEAERALEHDAIHVSGGRRGLEIELAPQDLQRLTRATVAPISGSRRR